MSSSVKKEILQHVVEISPIPSILVVPRHSEFTVLYVNKAFEDLSGIPETRLTGKVITDLFKELNFNVSGEINISSLLNNVFDLKEPESIDKVQSIILDNNGFNKQKYWKVDIAPLSPESQKGDHALITFLDITPETSTIKEQETLLNNAEESIMLLDEDLNIVTYNSSFADKYKQYLGHELEIGKPILDIIPDNRKKATKEKYQQVLNGKSLRLEIPFSTIDHGQKVFEIVYKPIKNESGDIDQVFVSMLEITDQYQEREENSAKEARYRTLVEHGNDVVIILSPDGKPSYISPSIKKVLGYTVQEGLDFDVSTIIHPDDQSAVMRELQKSLENPSVPLTVPPARMKHKNGKWKWFDGTITNMLHDPTIGGIVDNFKEITDRVNAEEKLKETKELYQSLIQSIEGVVWEAKADTYEFTYVSPQSENLFGYPPEKWLEDADFWEKNIHPEDRKESVEYCQRQTAKGLNHDFEYRFKKASGEYMWIRDVVTVIYKDGKPDLLRGLMIDITEQKRLIHLMDETYEIAKIGNWELNVAEEELFWSPFIKRLHEVPPYYEPDLKTAIDFYEEGRSRKRIQQAVNNAIEHNQSFDVELTIITAKGKKKWVRVVGTPEQANGECIRIFGSTQDITERKVAREKLKKAEEKYRNVVEHSTNMFYTHGIDGVLTYVSPQSEYFLGHEPEEAKRRWTEFITDHPINQKGIKVTQKAIKTGKTQPPYELQLKTGKEEIIWVEVNEAPLVVDGKTVSIVGSLTDITERKKYEEKLQESLERYNYVTKATRDAIYDWDANKDSVHWGDGLNTLFGYKPEDIDASVSGWVDLIHPEDVEEVQEELKFTLKDASMNHWTYEYRLKKADGDYSHVRETGYIIRDEDGKAQRMIGTIQDITEEVLTKKEIRTSLSEKETLLSEIHHRVKNNLAVVSGMMQLQAYDTEDAELQAKLFDSVVRIKTMATVHELLYQSQSFSKLEFSDTLQKLVENISETLRTNTIIDTSINCEPIKLSINQAIPASLIVNEVLTNIYKHAFNGRKKGNVEFRLEEIKNEIIILIKDDGVGFPDDFDVNVNTSLGFHLIRVLSEQINADFKYENEKSGTVFQLTFKKQDNSGIGNRNL